MERRVKVSETAEGAIIVVYPPGPMPAIIFLGVGSAVTLLMVAVGLGWPWMELRGAPFLEPVRWVLTLGYYLTPCTVWGVGIGVAFPSWIVGLLELLTFLRHEETRLVIDKTGQSMRVDRRMLFFLKRASKEVPLSNVRIWSRWETFEHLSYTLVVGMDVDLNGTKKEILVTAGNNESDLQSLARSLGEIVGVEVEEREMKVEVGTW